MAFPSSPIRDNFNRASLGANWTAPFLDATALANPNGTQLPGLGGFADGAYTALGGLSGGIVEAFITVATRQTGILVESVLVYFLDSSKSGYGVEFDSDTIQIYRIDTGASTGIHSTAITLANGDVVGMKYTPAGTLVEAFQNGAVASSFSDAAHTTMDRIGIESGNATTIRLDDFGGGIAGSAAGAASWPYGNQLPVLAGP